MKTESHTRITQTTREDEEGRHVRKQSGGPKDVRGVTSPPIVK